ncbi:BREX protein BrxB domain-containing protein [Kyrpidia tusciae]|uniref:BREX protein BrxB domain-containing protein n=1 Tax=Kyrpidia tusciae TaxID=33943 RepID=UPI0002FAB935|nr:BREX protein BrxB domain-containing protein [Kyrpidia tusciae]
MQPSLQKKMDALEQMMDDEGFLRGEGQGNELSYYVFDYDPKDEWVVRRFVNRLVRQSSRRIVNVNLYQAVLSLFEDEVGLDTLFEIEATEGTARLQRAMMPVLDSDRLVRSVAAAAEGAEALLLTGVGSLYPLLRSHGVLNRLHEWVTDVPVVLFSPARTTEAS